MNGTAATTGRLLMGGIAAGPVFIAVAVIQMLIRPGFDLGRHAISMLSLGDLGWIQTVNFVASGILTMACAVGLRRALGSGRAATWGPILVGAYGLGLVGAGVFATDPGFGFPPGAPSGTPETFSWHATAHSLAFMVATLAITAASIVFARRFWALRGPGWTAHSVATAVAIPALVFVGVGSPSAAGLAFFVVTLATWAWLTAIAADEYTERKG